MKKTNLIQNKTISWCDQDETCLLVEYDNGFILCEIGEHITCPKEVLVTSYKTLAEANKYLAEQKVRAEKSFEE